MYHFSISKEEQGWLFELYPNNSNNQIMGKSNYHNSPEICLETLKKFQNWVIENRLCEEDSENVVISQIVENEKKKYTFSYHMNGEIIFSRGQSTYLQKINCKKALYAIYKNINADIRKK